MGLDAKGTASGDGDGDGVIDGEADVDGAEVTEADGELLGGSWGSYCLR
jgi:hypothetical protein